MLRRVCPFCEVRALLKLPPPQQTRLYTQVQRERGERHGASSSRPPRPSSGFRGRDNPRPSRMVLADDVARTADRAPTRKPDAFDFLNRTDVPRGLERIREQREARGSRAATGRDDGKRRTRSEPFHALKMQSSLHQVPYNNRTAVKRQLEQYDSFDKFPLAEPTLRAVNDALPGLEYRNPTPAQAVAIPALLGLQKAVRAKVKTKKSGPDSFLLAAETGSGKTLAYLLPTLDAIKQEEVREKEDAEEQAKRDAEEAALKEHDRRTDMFAVEEPETNKAVDPARPRAIILVPSAELVAQVGAVAKRLSHTIKFRAAPISAKMSATVIRNQLFNPNGVDVVISTPPLLASIAESNPNILARVTHLICDEADSLFDRSFKESTTEILERATPSLKKLVLCSATIPKYLDKYLADRFPDMQRLVTPNLHAIPRRVQLGVVDVNKDPYRGNKMLACADTVWQIGKASADFDPNEGKEVIPTKRVLVFVNEREDTEEVAQYLVKKGIDAHAFHRDTDPTRQANILKSFTNDASTKETAENQEKKTEPANKRILPNTKVIVTTDLGSRGIDTVSVRHVILYDVPHTTIDFIHRLGRTGRMGRRGRGIVLLGPGDRADVVREVREAMFRGEALI
ncbi:ATP-dependent RNA helicase [Alternaria arborescens]|jgi:ATP-dependent RNA helicase MRH4|uniref:RNA helicase n=3 Tax=Alternaria sect. Alternaria TaxID=2499237 RepID=A0A4Q4RSE1_9PLEO|nr:P-loop containing nucleoside triphosphate hydrolase protein [Alternaria alternata]RYN22343.1 ATP-dependent RNA helicase [Alternaria tenuissima]RYO60085.1 ATP-dependent RNA helicase [Alternaria arborescens]RYN65161.1 ATP-dependent RNA helicase [Alternaria tenuissima]RYN87652.1 ATP-dependent RNA helicase [Alternaria tenuissima]